jgi:hypothetical protein
MANGSPMGAALAEPASTTTLLANKADTARIRNGIDMNVSFKVRCSIVLKQENWRPSWAAEILSAGCVQCHARD